jgi:RNA polymerase sigma-70 factor (ECF subfamily)
MMNTTITNNMQRTISPTVESVSTLTDETLLVRYRTGGDRDLFAQLVDRYQRELFNYLRRYLGNAEMAEDVFQATFLQVHLKCDQFQETRKFRPWLYTIAINQAIDAQRRNRRHQMVSLDRVNSGRDQDVGKLLDTLISEQPGPDAVLDSAERQRWTREAVQQLPETLKGALVLVYYQGMKYREAADVLGVPVGTVKSRLHAAIHKISSAWSEDHAEAS